MNDPYLEESICKHSHLKSFCPFCEIESERDALSTRVAELTAWVHARQGCPSLAEVDAVNNHYREALEHIATCGAHESPQAIATEALKVQA